MEIHDSSKKGIVDFLVKIGFLIPYNSVKLYHGRTSRFDSPGQEWAVDPNFNNADNNTGNLNVNGISALSTADYATARDFAQARNSEAYRTYMGETIDPSTAQVIRIVTDDSDAMIINSKFNASSLSVEDKEHFASCMKELSNYSLSEFAPVLFEERGDYTDVVNALKFEMIVNHKAIATNDIIEAVKEHFKSQGKVIDDHIIEHVAGAYNAKWFLQRYPTLVLDRYVLEKNPYKRNTIDGFIDGFDGPLNLEYFASWCYHNHIIGCKTLINSATLGKKIDNYMIFDKHRIFTEKALGEKMQAVISVFGEIEKSISHFCDDEQFMHALKSSNPHDSINLLAHKGFLEPYLLSAGVWEGFLIGEHTETVLRIFDDTYRDDIPDSMIPFMKFAILIHDIGKGYAVKNNEKVNQKIYNESYCRNEVFKSMKISPKMQELLLYIIGESQEYAANIYLPRPVEVVNASKQIMIERSTTVLRNFLGREPSRQELIGLNRICKILIACDGGAYTRYAITRDKKSGYYYRNGNDKFTSSFAKPNDLRNREIKFPEKQ